MKTSNTQKLIGSLVLAGTALIGTITQWEGTKPTPYKDVVGVQTVCSGHTGGDIVAGKVYTQAECDKLTQADVLSHGHGVIDSVTVPLNQNQYDALTDFAFNLGVGTLRSSRAVALINQGRYTEGCKALAHGPPRFRSKYCTTAACQKNRQNNADPVYAYAGGKFYKGLFNRRVAERDLCLKPVEAPTQTETS
jgi:lysozyme